MSALSSALHGNPRSASPARPSVFRRVLNAMVEARMREAQRQVNTYLLELDDQTLAAHGYSRSELKKTGTTFRTF